MTGAPRYSPAITGIASFLACFFTDSISVCGNVHSHFLFRRKENISLAEGEFHLRSKFHIRFAEYFIFYFAKAK